MEIKEVEKPIIDKRGIQYLLMDCLILEKDDKSIISLPRHSFKIEKNIVGIDGRMKKVVLAEMIQFPVCVSYAMTVHKSQGASIDYMVGDMSYIFSPHQAYTLLSRAKSTKGLQIINWNHRKVMVDARCFNFYKKIYDKQRKE